MRPAGRRLQRAQALARLLRPPRICTLLPPALRYGLVTSAARGWSSQHSVDRPSPQFLGRFELLWAHAAEVTMSAASIVETIDVVGHIVRRQLSVLVDPLLDAFFLQTAEEGL